MPRKQKVTLFGEVKVYVGYGSESRQHIKKRHKKKQRQHNNKLSNEVFSSRH